MGKYLAAAVVAFSLATPCFASDDISPEHLALAQQAMELSGVTKYYDNFDQNMSALMAQKLQSIPNVDPTVVADLKKIAHDDFAAYKPRLMDGTARIHARHFTEDDLRALIAFYESDAGRHFVAEMPAVQQEWNQLYAPFTKQFVEHVDAYVAAKKAAMNQQKSKH